MEEWFSVWRRTVTHQSWPQFPCLSMLIKFYVFSFPSFKIQWFFENLQKIWSQKLKFFCFFLRNPIHFMKTLRIFLDKFTWNRLSSGCHDYLFGRYRPCFYKANCSIEERGTIKYRHTQNLQLLLWNNFFISMLCLQKDRD